MVAVTKLRVALGCAVSVMLVSCAPAPAATLLEVTTNQTVCGGAYYPELPPCRTSPASRTVQISMGRDVVATGTTGSDGTLVLAVPVGELVLSIPGAEPYMNCDAPTVTSISGRTTPVVQTCTLLYP
jgi:hypothetical protein